MVESVVVKRKRWVVEEDLKPYMHPLTPWNKQLVLPNLEEILDPKKALVALAGSRAYPKFYDSGFKLPKPSGYSTYAKLFLHANSDGSAWDGSGLVLTHHNTDVGRVFKFALCVHEKTEEGHNPNHGRGWHPGHCVKCGMDMTVDSGD